MGKAVRMSIGLLCSLGCAVPLRAEELSGRYLGTLNRSQTNGTTTDRMSHLYDATLRDVITNGIDLELGTSFRYDSRPGIANTSILRSRFYGDVKNTVWRLRSSFIPWQRTQPGNDERRRRDITVGADLTPRRGPRLFLNYKRADRESEVGMTQSDDLRADLSYSMERVATHLSARHLESNGSSPKSITNELRAGISARHHWRTLAVSGSYDAVATDTKKAASQNDRLMQDLGAVLGWRPHRKVSVSSNLAHRWEQFGGEAPQDQEPRRTSISTKLSVLPYTGLNVDLSQEYRKVDVASGAQVTDFLRFVTTYTRQLVHQVLFKSGYTARFDVSGQNDDNTLSGLFIAAHGRLRENLQGGAELRASRFPGRSMGTMWSKSANVRTKPTRLTTFDLRWRSDVSQQIQGRQQDDQLWDFSLAYRPVPGVNMNVSHRRQNGEGRVDRADRLWNLSLSWRLADRSSARAFGSTRTTHLVDSERTEEMIGGDFTFWPTENFELRGRYQYAKQSGAPASRTYGVNLSRLF